ncbi:MAG: hypothetical protein IPJ69_02655 [Deltaproteobacteria bacterium]|nr:MAG: hypothetical protein IPJ69_02655 [Deltaproteobacteria bacterium]
MVETGSHFDATSLPEYFRELVKQALEHQRVKAPEEIEFYLVNLLQSHMFAPESLRAPESSSLKEQPLAILYLKAQQSEYETKLTLLKQLGDSALFTSGYFPASLNRQLVDIKYYAQMGGSAYADLAQIVSKNIANMFEDLAGHFLSYADVLSEVSESCQFTNDKDILRHYETWLKTGSSHSFNRLAQKGIIPTQQSLKTQ